MLTFLLSLALTSFQGYERVLEVACGDGTLTAQLAHDVPDGLVLGIDADPQNIAFAERTYDPDLFANLQFALGTPNELTQTAEFEVIVLHKIPNEEGIERLAKALRPKGRVVLSLPPQPECLFAALARLATTENWSPWLANIPETLPYDPKVFAEAGFLPLQCHVEEKTKQFVDRHDVSQWLLDWLPLPSIPTYRKAALVDALIDELLLADPALQDAEGFYLPCKQRTAELKKVAL